MERRASGISFEEALEQLEKVVRQLEQGDVPLEESIKLFEKGITLSRICQKKLDQAEAKIEVLTKQDDEVIKESFAVEENS